MACPYLLSYTSLCYTGSTSRFCDMQLTCPTLNVSVKRDGKLDRCNCDVIPLDGIAADERTRLCLHHLHVLDVGFSRCGDRLVCSWLSRQKQLHLRAGWVFWLWSSSTSCGRGSCKVSYTLRHVTLHMMWAVLVRREYYLWDSCTCTCQLVEYFLGFLTAAGWIIFWIHLWAGWLFWGIYWLSLSRDYPC